MTKALEAMTRDDIRILLHNALYANVKTKDTRGAARVKPRNVGRKQGQGKRTGTKKARSQPKKMWQERPALHHVTLNGRKIEEIRGIISPSQRK